MCATLKCALILIAPVIDEEDEIESNKNLRF